MRDDFNIQFATQNLLEDQDVDETSTTSGVGVYQRKKGERTKGGMIYKDLWNEADSKEDNEADSKEDLEIGDRVKVVYGNEFYGYNGTIDDIRRGFVVVDVDGEGLHSMHISDVEKIEDEEDEDDDSISDYMRYRKDPDYYEKQYQEKGTSDYFQRRSLDEEGNDLGEVFATQEKDKVRQLLDKLKQIDANAYRKLLMAIVDPRPFSYSDAEKELTGQMALSENYSRFKNETKTRGKADQFHQAIREVKKRVHEIHKVFEYVNRLKEELNEGEDGLKYKKHTEAAVSKIKEMVSELNMKVKKFK